MASAKNKHIQDVAGRLDELNLVEAYDAAYAALTAAVAVVKATRANAYGGDARPTVDQDGK